MYNQDYMGVLYIVSTPIGNRKDISLRALEVLEKVKVILCEDTRKTGMLLKSYEEELREKFSARLESFFEENEEGKITKIVEWLKQGEDIALVSNAGTPLLSDPGFKLVRSCVEKGIRVEAIPGASALLTALVISGLPSDKFMFFGFLPKKQGKRIKILECLKKINEVQKQTFVFYESPFRILKALKDIGEILPGAQVVLTRELTKKFEEVKRGTAIQLIKQLEGKKIKGEITVCLRLN